MRPEKKKKSRGDNNRTGGEYHYRGGGVKNRGETHFGGAGKRKGERVRGKERGEKTTS